MIAAIVGLIVLAPIGCRQVPGAQPATRSGPAPQIASKIEPGPWLVVDSKVEDALAGSLIYHQGPVPPKLQRRVSVQAPGDPATLSWKNIIVEAVISPEGKVARARVLRGPETQGLGAALVESLRHSRFQPARLAGKPVAVYYALILPLEYRSGKNGRTGLPKAGLTSGQYRSERQEANLRLQLLGPARQKQEFKILDDLTDGTVRQDHDDPRHRHSRTDPLPGVTHQGLYVVSEKNSVLIGSELEESLVVRSVQRGILGPHHVQIRDLSPESTEDTAIEILVSQEAQHGCYRPRRARSRSRRPV
jgi:hypothetical protein